MSVADRDVLDSRWARRWSAMEAVALADRDFRVVARIKDERVTVPVVRVAYRRERSVDRSNDL